MTFEQSKDIEKKIKYCRILEELLVLDEDRHVAGLEYRVTYPDGDEEAYDEILHIIYDNDSTIGILITGMGLSDIAREALKVLK